jgi:hypothetical protein
MAGPLYLPLVDHLEHLWPDSLLERPPLSVLEGIWFEPFRITTSPSFNVRTGLLLERACEIRVPGLESVRLVIGADGAETTCILQLEADTSVRGQLIDIPIILRIDSRFIRPVTLVLDSNGNAIGYEIDMGAQYLDVTLAMATVTIDAQGRGTVDADADIQLPLCSIGDTGILVEGIIDFDLNLEDPTLHIREARVVLPEDLPVPAGTSISFQDARLNSTGFSGSVAIDLPLHYNESSRTFEYVPLQPGQSPEPAYLFGISGGLRHIGLVFEQNQLTACDIIGSILVPYFDEPVDVRLNILPDGTFSVTLLNLVPDKPLTKEQLLALYLQSLKVEKDAAGNVNLVVSGGLQPLLQAGDGMGWPRLDVKDLRIDSTGKLSIKEAWLDLTECKPLDLWGFSLDLDRIGIGFEDPTQRIWLDLSGSLRLIEQIPVGLGVEGFRLTWPIDLGDIFRAHGDDPLALAAAIAEQIEVQFKGVQLFFGVPDAIEFEGLIRFFKSAQAIGFCGDMALRVPATGFGAEAGLLVGMTPDFPFLYVTLAVDLPAGIPLGQSGLALKGAQGLFGLNVRPDKAVKQNWYYDWYKRTPVGAHPATKWTYARDALAFGVGVTITTADGYVKGTRGLLVLTLPGPVLMIEGRALMLSGLTPGEPPLRALAVFDGNAGTVQFNVEAQATIVEDMLDAYGGMEAFFDFNNITNWHLYLGQDEPADRRIRANVLDLFKADAYLMLDMVNTGTLRSRMGVSVGFKPPIDDIGPLHVDFDATLEGNGMVTVRPEQFSGDATLRATIGLSTFGFSAQLAARAAVSTDGPIPLQVATEVEVRVEPPSPLDPVEHTFEFSWQSPDASAVVSPLTEIAVNSRFAPSGGGFSPDADESHRIHKLVDLPESTWEELAEKSPVVPLDAEAILAFGQVMNSRHFARHPSGERPTYNVGPIKFSPRLAKVELFEHKKSDDWWTGWTSVAVSGDAGKPLAGVWLAESDPQSPEAPAPRRLQLGTDNPLIHSGRASGFGANVWMDRPEQKLSPADRLLEDYPDLMRPGPEPTWACVRFDDASGVVLAPGTAWQHHGLQFSVPEGGSTFAVQQETETHSGPASPLTAVRKKEIVRALGTQHRPFLNPVNITLQSLRAWADSITPAQATQLRKRWPDMAWLWEWLFPRTTTRYCLQGEKSASIEIRFPVLVREVHIRFCGTYALPSDPTEGQVITARRPRTLGEVGTVLDEARKGSYRPDFQTCSVAAQANLSASGDRWILSADEGFQCLLIEVQDKGIAIQEICYLTVAEAERAERAEEEAQDNGDMPLQPGGLLKPGCYYRLEVATEVEGAIDFDGFLPPGWLGEALEQAYRLAAGAVGFNTSQEDPTNTWPFQQAVFFQTEGPPASLRPYVKWSSPEHQTERVFCSNDMVVRFLRTGVNAMFEPPFGIAVRLRDAQGKLVDVNTKWGAAFSATLFPEEAAWEKHRKETLGFSARPLPDDDLLLARLGPGATLKPKTRYTVEIRRTDRPVSDEMGLLHAFCFTTSAYDSFESLIESFAGQAVTITGTTVPLPSSIQSALNLARDLAVAEPEWQRALVDYRFDLLPGGRAGLETARLKRRQARAGHDDSFRRIAEQLAESLYYQPTGDRLELYQVRNPADNKVIGIWLRSPESLDLRFSTVATGSQTQGEWFGRTEITLSSPSLSSSPTFVSLSNADSTQVLLFSVLHPDWAPGTYTLKFTYLRDQGDEARDGEHRYDRPVEMSGGRHAPVVAKIAFTL